MELLTNLVCHADQDTDVFCGILIAALDAAGERVEHDQRRGLGELPKRSQEPHHLRTLEALDGLGDELDPDLPVAAMGLLPGAGT